MNDNPWWIHFQTEGAFYAQNKRPSSWTFRWWQLPWIKMPQWWCHLLHVAVKVDSVPFMHSFKLFMLLMKAFRNSTTQPRDSRCVPRIKVSDSIEMEKNLDIYTGDDMLVLLLVRSNMLHLRMYTRHWKGADFCCLRIYLKINLKFLRTILA